MTSDWMSALKSVPIDWLLEADNQPVRFFTMRDLLEYKSNDSELIEARQNLGRYRVTQNILSKQKPEGFWESKDEPYLPKYKSSFWQVMLLGMFGMDRSNPQIGEAVGHLLDFQHEDGGFVEFMERGAKKEYELVRKRNLARRKVTPSFEEWAPAKIRESELSCLTGNVALALIRLGYSEHRAIDDALAWLVEIQNIDGGWLCPYWGAHKNDKHGCFMGTITPLDAFSETPKKHRSIGIRRAIKRGVEFILMHRLYKSDHHDFRIINKQWLMLTFPQFFYDIVRGLAVVTKLGFEKDSRIDDALDVIMNKQLASGEWVLERTLSGRLYGSIEHKGKPSKWITLEILRIIKQVVQSRGHFELQILD
nr:MAG: hypothetical protein AM325_01560 [Candidatus Thorarchaeota archaeon SMTZ1-45]